MKQVIDKHFAEHYQYYHKFCNRLYNGRYLAEDLLHEAYLFILTVPEKRIQRFKDRLKTLVLFKITDIYYNKGRKKTCEAGTSPLFETCNPCDFNFEYLLCDNSDYVDLKAEEEALIKIEEKIAENLKGKDWYHTAVFLQVQEDSVTGLSKRTNIHRPSIYKSCNMVKLELRRYAE